MRNPATLTSYAARRVVVLGYGLLGISTLMLAVGALLWLVTSTGRTFPSALIWVVANLTLWMLAAFALLAFSGMCLNRSLLRYLLACIGIALAAVVAVAWPLDFVASEMDLAWSTNGEWGLAEWSISWQQDSPMFFVYESESALMLPSCVGESVRWTKRPAELSLVGVKIALPSDDIYTRIKHVCYG